VSFGLKVTGEKRVLNSELWHACAGPLVSLPPVGSRVVYFPQGHSEQVFVSFLLWFGFKSFLFGYRLLENVLWFSGCCFDQQRSRCSYTKLSELASAAYLSAS